MSLLLSFEHDCANCPLCGEGKVETVDCNVDMFSPNFSLSFECDNCHAEFESDAKYYTGNSPLIVSRKISNKKMINVDKLGENKIGRIL